MLALRYGRFDDGEGKGTSRVSNEGICFLVDTHTAEYHARNDLAKGREGTERLDEAGSRASGGLTCRSFNGR
jgi:hypothetical protein